MSPNFLSHNKRSRLFFCRLSAPLVLIHTSLRNGSEVIGFVHATKLNSHRSINKSQATRRSFVCCGCFIAHCWFWDHLLNYLSENWEETPLQRRLMSLVHLYSKDCATRCRENLTCGRHQKRVDKTLKTFTLLNSSKLNLLLQLTRPLLFSSPLLLAWMPMHKMTRRKLILMKTPEHSNIVDYHSQYSELTKTSVNLPQCK